MKAKIVFFVLLTVAACVLAFHDAVVQIYTKVFVSLQYAQQTQTEVYIDGKLVEKKVETKYIEKESLELWLLGSGAVIWSGQTPSGETKTLVLTNFHVVEYCINPPTELKHIDKALLVVKRVNNRLEPVDIAKSAYRLIIERVEGPFLIFYMSFKRNRKHTFEVRAQVEKYDSLLDVAVISLHNVKGVPCVELATSVDDYAIGEQISIFGAPLGIPFQLTKGTLGQKHLDADPEWLDMLRYDCPQAPGSSGSPIFASDGKVIGIVRGSYVSFTGSAYDGQHLGIAIDNIRDWLFFNGYQFLLESR